VAEGKCPGSPNILQGRNEGRERRRYHQHRIPRKPKTVWRKRKVTYNGKNKSLYLYSQDPRKLLLIFAAADVVVAGLDNELVAVSSSKLYLPLGRSQIVSLIVTLIPPYIGNPVVRVPPIL
jgi:hypothetical protein